jgi:hypothetical protein
MKCPHCGKTIPRNVIVQESGRIGGKKIAKRGPEYFRQLQAKRKTKAGGRPPKETTTVPTEAATTRIPDLT